MDDDARNQLLEADFPVLVDMLNHACVSDFARYVARQRREIRGLDDTPFAEAWAVVLGGYAMLAAALDDAPDMGDDG